ncbi:MAG: DEAD/DEAH box helicase family protein [Bacteroidales bacterium]|nr:DEAD/DEAH box helicase family protein [Bacteroidales bacterium]
MNKNEALKEINITQDFYVDKLISYVEGAEFKYSELKEINFSSPTGTGKTVMMAKLINKLESYFFIITSLSRGQLRYQIEEKLKELCPNKNFLVFGLNEFTKTTKMQALDYLNLIPKNKKIIWIRDEGHIATNRWQEIFRDLSSFIVNFSATNKEDSGIQCNFTHTMMLRTVVQQSGSPEDAISKLLEVKRDHKDVKNYNPCALFRILDSKITNYVIALCKQKGLRCINITDEDFDMSKLCSDNNEYDVIINKFKITEGIDLRRCHVIYIDNKPGNEATTIQVIGRSRRNALFWRNDIDILDCKNTVLLEKTRLSYVFYNVPEAEVKQNSNGELLMTLCDRISVQSLKTDIDIEVINGQLKNGLYIVELENKTGTFHISIDPETGFNIVNNSDFYKTVETSINHSILDLSFSNYNIRKVYFNKTIAEIFEREQIEDESFPLIDTSRLYLWEKCQIYERFYKYIDKIEYYSVRGEVIVNTFLWKLKLIEKTGSNFKFDKFYDPSYFELNNVKTLLSLKMKLRTKKSFCRYPSTVWNLLIKYLKIKKLDDFLAYNNKVVSLDELNQIFDLHLTDEEVAWYKNNSKLSVLTSNFDQINVYRFSTYDNSYKNLKFEHRILLYKNDQSKIYVPYKKIVNDKEIATIGPDIFKYTNGGYFEDSAVTSKITKYCKFNLFIETKFRKILDENKDIYFSVKNDYEFDRRLNSCIGYCVEYFSKILVFGEKPFQKYIDMAKSDVDYFSRNKMPKNIIYIRAAYYCYREEMTKIYGTYMNKLIPSISIDFLIRKNSQKFIQAVEVLGNKVANFVNAEMNIDGKNYDPNLSVNHISALADYINADTIIDIKCTGYINEKYIKQILSYYYLSTKRSDLHIKKLIVYDAISGKFIKMNMQ